MEAWSSSFAEISLSVEKHLKIDKKCTNCRSFEENGIDKKNATLIFLSFSVPEKVWLALDSEDQDKIFILRGCPNNSFKKLGTKIANLKEKGFKSTIEINPKLFQKYAIDKVPTFVIKNKQGFDKVLGNISLKTALEITGN